MCGPTPIILAVATTIFLFTEQGSCQVDYKPVFKVTPKTMIMEPSDVDDHVPNELTAVCSLPSTARNMPLYVIRLTRHLTGHSEKETMALTDLGSKEPRFNSSLHGARLFGGIVYRCIRMVMTEITCHDEGNYHCEMSVGGQGTTISAYTTVAFTVLVTPGLIMLMAYKSTTTLNITCDAIVGTANDANEIKWHWEYRTADSIWDTYNGKPTDISVGPLRNGTLANPNETCYKSQSSRLLRPMIQLDASYEFRCYVTNTRVTGNYTKFARVYSVIRPHKNKPNDQNVAPIEPVPPKQVNPPADQEDFDPDLAASVKKPDSEGTKATSIVMYVAIGVGSLFVLAAVVTVWRYTSGSTDNRQPQANYSSPEAPEFQPQQFPDPATNDSYPPADASSQGEESAYESSDESSDTRDESSTAEASMR